jgi:hypothetical protein
MEVGMFIENFVLSKFSLQCPKIYGNLSKLFFLSSVDNSLKKLYKELLEEMMKRPKIEIATHSTTITVGDKKICVQFDGHLSRKQVQYLIDRMIKQLVKIKIETNSTTLTFPFITPVLLEETLRNVAQGALDKLLSAKKPHSKSRKKSSAAEARAARRSITSQNIAFLDQPVTSLPGITKRDVDWGAIGMADWCVGQLVRETKSRLKEIGISERTLKKILRVLINDNLRFGISRAVNSIGWKPPSERAQKKK